VSSKLPFKQFQILGSVLRKWSSWLCPIMTNVFFRRPRSSPLPNISMVDDFCSQRASECRVHPTINSLYVPARGGAAFQLLDKKNKPCHTSKKWKDCTETNAQHKCITVFFLQLFVSFSWPFFLLQLSSLQSLTWLARMVLFYLFKRKNNWAMKNTLPSHCPGWFIGIPIMDNNNPQENS